MRKHTSKSRRRRRQGNSEGNSLIVRPTRGQHGKGRAGLGNTRALKHGLRSRKAQLGLLPGQEELRALLSSRLQRLHDDQGGTAELSQVLEDTLENYQGIWMLKSTLEARIKAEGMLTGKGRTRASVTLYLSIVDRMTRLAQQLGFQRKTKRVPSIEDFIKQREQEGDHA